MIIIVNVDSNCSGHTGKLNSGQGLLQGFEALELFKKCQAAASSDGSRPCTRGLGSREGGCRA